MKKRLLSPSDLSTKRPTRENHGKMKAEWTQLKWHIVTIEDLPQKEHFLRKLDAALYLSFVYHEIETLHSCRHERPRWY